MTDPMKAASNEIAPPSPPEPVMAIVVQALTGFQFKAASRARSDAEKVIRFSTSAINQAAIISNNCHSALKKDIGAEPASGKYRGPLPNDAASIPAPAEAFQIWQRSPDSPASAKDIEFKDLTSALAKLLAQWIEKSKDLSGYNAPTYVMSSSGAGVEGVTVYKTNAPMNPKESETEPLVFVFYLNNPFIGSTEAGGFIMSRFEFESLFSNKDDPELDDVIDYIQKWKLYTSENYRAARYPERQKAGLFTYYLEYGASGIVTFQLSRRV
ncbi:hypothetical protein [Denitrobaculum tricleocarpae]|uniref:Uncharacterized protein n=1 Tax=Denitrobaculum tricleocarpae TaxID=2591009 RepID=A0A545TPV3_9PROT|nr:hypothetical protein [Denitrobaculum tricleocarpae]TQV79253.1 hypothetical protein FKG95_16510 [Denitrobaculum tricleocarpae]